MLTFKGKYTNADVMIDSIDKTTAAQINKFINHPAFTEPVKIMPDCHAGKGSVIGFTMPLNPEKIIPNTIGVDIGCGMYSFNLGPDLFKNITEVELENRIRQSVPMGFDVHSKPVLDMEKGYPWSTLYTQILQFIKLFHEKYGIKTLVPKNCGLREFRNNCNHKGLDYNRAACSLGTLGGGK